MTDERPAHALQATLHDEAPDSDAGRDRAIWLAVIAQALDDATMIRAAIKPAVRAQARAWLTTMGADFREVCALAGMEPERLRVVAEQRIAEAGDSKCATRVVERVTYQGESLTISQWAKRTGLPDLTIRGRLRLGWNAERALTTPSRRPRQRHDRGVGRASERHAGTGALPAAKTSAELEISA